MKSKGWRIFRLTGKGLAPVPFEPNGWQNQHGNHISKKAALDITSGLLESLPKGSEFVVLEVFCRESEAAGER